MNLPRAECRCFRIDVTMMTVLPACLLSVCNTPRTSCAECESNCRRLIRDHQCRVGHERARDGDALFLAAGHLFGQMLGAIRKSDEIQRRLHLLAALAAIQLCQQQRQLDILERRQHRDEIERLETNPTF